ncbi:glycosyltransferase [Gammaproteobacteria bacterium]|nr:glycosyltransferase [Gammaproteobacteria bacterium]
MTYKSIKIVKDLNILVISDAAPSRNGAGAYYLDLMEQLSERVNKIELYSPSIDENNKWHAGLVLPLPGDKTQKLCFPNFFKLNRLFTQLNPDVVIIATPGVFGLTGAFLAKRKKIPFLTGMHTSFEQLTELYWPNSLQGKIVEKYFLYSNRNLFHRTEAVLGNSSSILEQAKNMGANLVKLIGTPVSAEFSKTPLQNYSGELSSCLFAGRLAKEKNIEELLSTVEAMPELKFSIAGDGPLREVVINAAKKYDNLSYLGWLSRHELRCAVDAHDALLLPSHFETFGTIALEAMARQRLAVVSAGCGISNWSELSSGIVLIADTGLLATLKKLQQLAPAERLTITKQALTVALKLNSDVIDGWCQILMDTLHKYQGKE